MGGMAKRATVLAAMKLEAPNAIVVDSGALLYESIRLNSPFEPVHRMKARFIVDEVKKMGIDAANVSSMDLADSADSLLAYGNAGLPWLSVNIVWKKSGTLLFQPDTVKTVGDIRVGVFGFMDENSLGVPFFDESSALSVNNPTEAVRAEVQKLKKTSDLIIALAYMDLDRVEKLTADVPGIDVVIVSHTRSHNPGSEHLHFQPLKSGKTLIARCPDGGRVVGRLDLVMANGSTDFTDSESIKDLRPAEVKERDTSKNAVSIYTNTFTDLDPSVPRNEEIQTKVDRVMKIWEDIERMTNTKK
jgi:2',3'-cyclic-nucleotide 2'-phosphodiesterase (5'-nucleotidase family)